jgi:hypothetical protein
MAIVTTKNIHGVDVHFEVDNTGRFSAHLDEHGPFSATTLHDIEEEVTKVLKRASAAKKKALEVTFLNVDVKRSPNSWTPTSYVVGSGAVDATFRGVAARTNEWLVTIDGEKDKIRQGYSDGGITLCRRLTADEHIQWKQLQEARRVAATAIEDFIGVRKLNLKEED